MTINGEQPIRSQPTRQQLDITTGGGDDSETMEMYRDLLPERETVTKKRRDFKTGQGSLYKSRAVYL